MAPIVPPLLRRLALAGLLASGPLVLAGDDPGQQARAKAMRDMARAVAVKRGDDRNVEVAAEPAYRWDDPARKFNDGTVWVLGRAGRPAGLLTLSLGKDFKGDMEWLHELTCLANSPFTAEVRPGRIWKPPHPGIAIKTIPGDPAPADDEPKRLRQLREQARRFKAFETFDAPPGRGGERFELRMLTQPVHRYSDPTSGIVDGGVFLFAYGQNPEIALVIEARGEGGAAPEWSYGLGRIAMAMPHVSLDDKDLADWPADGGKAGPAEAYYLFGIPARDPAVLGDLKP